MNFEHPQVKRGLIILLPSFIHHKNRKKGKIVFIDCSFGQTRFIIAFLAEITIHNLVWLGICLNTNLKCRTLFIIILSHLISHPWPLFLINNIDIHMYTHTHIIYMPFINLCSSSFPVNLALFSQIHSFLYPNSNTKQPALVAWVLWLIHSSRPMWCASESMKYNLKKSTSAILSCQIPCFKYLIPASVTSLL